MRSLLDILTNEKAYVDDLNANQMCIDHTNKEIKRIFASDPEDTNLRYYDAEVTSLWERREVLLAKLKELRKEMREYIYDISWGIDSTK